MRFGSLAFLPAVLPWRGSALLLARRTYSQACTARTCSHESVVLSPFQIRACEKQPNRSSDGSLQSTKSFKAPFLRGPVILVLYVAFVLQGAVFGPGKLGDPGVLGLIFSGRLSEVNDLYLSVFNCLGVVAGVYAALLMPAESKQPKLNPLIFSIFGFAFGFGALGPYLALRKFVPRVSREDLSSSRIARFLESKFYAVSLLAYAIFTYVLGLGLAAPSATRDTVLFTCWLDTVHLFQTDRLVHASLLDAALLCILLWGPLCEDMRRRGWIFDRKHIDSYINAACVLAAPGLGPALYLVLRSPLPSSVGSKTEEAP